MSRPRYLPIAAIPLFLFACVRCETTPAASGSVVIMSYNLQTLFDPVDQGGEYEEFRVSTGAWSEALYTKRLAALASAVAAASLPGGSGKGPDVLVVQEAENARVLRDLAEAAGGYPYIAASPDEDANLGCGVLSRYPITAVRAHRVRKPDGAPSSVPRYLLEVELDIGGRSLVLIAAHLKSKLGGAEETEAERRAATAFASMLVGTRLADDPSLAVVIAGDFNENPDEFERIGRAYPTALMAPDAGPGPWLLISGDRGSFGTGSAVADSALVARAPVLYCPWEEGGGYSYRYRGECERIDQLLLSPGLVSDGGCPLGFQAFSAEPPEFAIDADGNPLGWNARSGSGYSDHLPIRVRLTLLPW
jgi:endonuclease/exonuclease/phosphatase family metal-dependent hydrolase